MATATRKVKALIILSCIITCFSILQKITKQQRSLLFSLTTSNNNIGNDNKNDATSVLPPLLTQDQIDVMFDCDKPKSYCRYFSPYEFFRNGPGYDFLDEYNRTLGGNNENLPAITTLRSWPRNLNNNKKSNTALSVLLPYRNTANKYQSLSFVHCHKAGGSTVIAAIHRAASAAVVANNKMKKREPKKAVGNSAPTDKEDEEVVVNVTTYKYAIGPTSKQDKIVNGRRRYEFIKMVADQPPPTASEHERHIVFSVIRDPVERFISGIQQVMHYHDDLRTTCLDENSARNTIQCSINFVSGIGKTSNNNNYQYKKYLGDVHLQPMVSHFRVFDQFPTINRIRVFQLEKHITYLSQDFLAGSNNSNKMIIHERNSRNDVTKATSQVLSKMSTNDCTFEMIQSICNLYAIDVAMMDYLGIPTPYCSTTT